MYSTQLQNFLLRYIFLLLKLSSCLIYSHHHITSEIWKSLVIIPWIHSCNGIFIHLVIELAFLSTIYSFNSILIL